MTGSLGALSQAVFGGYAATSTNGGHDERATGNIQDFSSVAIDEAASLGKAATKIFYRQSQKYAYWNGCSTRGRQGHMLAQRYPTKYDNILAGSPAIN
ncbi:uncharacterized protein N7506_003827 [Penicillium brevicompactum]|uniref:uncharacterized protein n=1 Tax=Penicillium brevicompactum TaxID=5074 RepID=UPI0025409E3A|nr:uncharacterized protein N7506_003827 [Penicillium brevicompactum]KAJ5344003.1 hypothetical protein N7506_003827 [Penicillium brevicompactum]